jgi:hypothetical protein
MHRLAPAGGRYETSTAHELEQGQYGAENSEILHHTDQIDGTHQIDLVILGKEHILLGGYLLFGLLLHKSNELTGLCFSELRPEQLEQFYR